MRYAILAASEVSRRIWQRLVWGVLHCGLLSLRQHSLVTYEMPHALSAKLTRFYAGAYAPTVIFVLKVAGVCVRVAVFSYFYSGIKFTFTIKEAGL